MLGHLVGLRRQLMDTGRPSKNQVGGAMKKSSEAIVKQLSIIIVRGGTVAW